MFISPAYAQAGGSVGGGGIEALLPLVLIFVVFYFLLIRPQQKKMKDHKAMLADIRRGDKVVTGGGIMGTVSKIDDEQIVTVEIAKDIKVKVRRELVSAVLNKTAPVSGAANDAGVKKSSGLLGGLFGGAKASPESAPATQAEPDQGDAPKRKPRKSRAKKKSATQEIEESSPGPDDRKNSDNAETDTPVKDDK